MLSIDGDEFAVVSHGDDKAAGGEGAATDVRSDRIAYEEALQREAKAWDDYNRKVEEGRKEAERLMKRFGPWYFVIDRALFEQLKPKREDLVEPKAAEAATDGSGAPATLPGGADK